MTWPPPTSSKGVDARPKAGMTLLSGIGRGANDRMSTERLAEA